MRNLLIVLFIFCMVACGKPPGRTPVPSPSSVFVAYPASLQPTLTRINRCAGEISGLVIYWLPDALMSLQLGSSRIEEKNVYQIGVEEILFIVNSGNPIESISTNEVQSIYSGEQANWEDSSDAIQVWSYPTENSLRLFVEEALPDAIRLTLRAKIAPNPQAMLEAVSSDSRAIGIIPASWMENAEEAYEVKLVTLDASLQEALMQPILVTLDELPTFELKALLACLQADGG